MQGHLFSAIDLFSEENFTPVLPHVLVDVSPVFRVEIRGDVSAFGDVGGEILTSRVLPGLVKLPVPHSVEVCVIETSVTIEGDSGVVLDESVLGSEVASSVDDLARI